MKKITILFAVSILANTAWGGGSAAKSKANTSADSITTESTADATKTRVPSAELGTDTMSDTISEEDTTLPMTSETKKPAPSETRDGSLGSSFPVTGEDEMVTRDDHSIAASDSLALSFKNGSSKLTPEHKSSLSNFINSFKTTTGIDSVSVAAWADRALPKSGSLGTKERTLAEARAKAVQTFIEEELGIVAIDSFNMADRSNWLVRSLDLDEAEMSSAFARADTDLTQSELSMIKSDGGVGKVVVVSVKKVEEDVD